MGNKASIDVQDCKGVESKSMETARMSSCSTLGTQPSDDKLRELAEAVKEDSTSKQRTGFFEKMGKVLFAPAEPQQPPPPPPRLKVRLCHCQTDDEHRLYVADFIHRVKDLHGEEGLREAGFEYKMVYCPQHEPIVAAASGYFTVTAQECHHRQRRRRGEKV